MANNFQRFKMMPIKMIKNQFLLGQKLLAFMILSSLFSLTTLSQEKKLTKEIEETDNITINKDYWKTFESPNDKNKTKNIALSSPIATAFLKIPENPFDTITVTHPFRPITTYKVEPINKFFKLPASDEVILRLRVIDKNFSFKELVTTGPTAIKEIKFFEETLAETVQKFIEGRISLDTNEYSSSIEFFDRLLLAEEVLEKGLRLHDSAIATEKRTGEGWGNMRKILATKLLSIRINKIQVYTEKKDWDQALFEISKLSSGSPDKETLQKLSSYLVDVIDGSNQSGLITSKTKELLSVFLFLESKLYSSESDKPLLNLLRKKSDMFYMQAENSQGKIPPEKTNEFLLRALELQPDHIKARQLLEKISPQKETLKVGLPKRPEFNNEALLNDSEIHAADLLYESLFRKETNVDGNSRTIQVLASSKITPTRNGVTFNLVPSSFWSNGKPVTAPEIQASMKKNKSLSWLHSDENILLNWNNNDTNSFEVKFKSGILDPFSLFDFKIIQENNTKYGSGPYRFSNKGTELGREHLVFKAQPFYSFRKENIGKPIIPEIRFYKSSDPVDDLITGKIDLAVDLNFQDITKIKKLNNNPPINFAQTGNQLPNKRVYFIAVNPNKGVLKSPEIRKAIAHSMLRSKVLADVWIGSEKGMAHQALESIFPKDYSFTNGLEKTESAWSQDLAKILQTQATENIPRQIMISISLKFPSGDTKTTQAIDLLASQIKSCLKIDVIPEPIDPSLYFKKIIEDRDYELAYAWHDYSDDNCSLYPLLFNYFRNHNAEFQHNQKLQSLLDTAKTTMLASTIPEMLASKKIMISLFEQELPLIPLWQLDRYWAWRRDLQLNFTDSLHLFQNASSWKKEPTN